MNRLRAIVRQVGDSYEAQLLELDIAVAAKSEGGLLREIENALILDYQIARERGQTPFAGLVHKTPNGYLVWWEEDGAKEHQLHLPEDVVDALAIALHTPGKPVFALQRYAQAA